MFGAGFWHHGILTDDNTIIHYAGMDGPKTLQSAYIMRTSLEEFQGSSDSKIHVVTYDPAEHRTIYDKKTIIKRAESRIGQADYDLLCLFNKSNCESFARWCVCGREVSEQATGAWMGLAAGAGSLFFGGGLLGAALTGVIVFKSWERRGNPSPDRRQPEDSDDEDSNNTVVVSSR